MNYQFSREKFKEAELEEAIIDLFQQEGYTHVYGADVQRQPEDTLLFDDLRAYLSDRYQHENLTETEIQKIINKLNLINETPLYYGNREAFWLVNEGFDLIRDDSSQTALHVEYIDYDHPEHNIFKVVNQYYVQAKSPRKPDMLLFINGIPVGIFEFKSAIREDATVYHAWEQITVDYCRDIPKLMKFCFLSVISDGANTRLGTIFTPYEYYYAWNKANDTDKVSNGISSLFTMIKGVFAKERVLSILRDFILYPDESQEQKAIVCRYPQFFGAWKMLENIKAHIKPDGDGKGGTYFGATGCGKTYTMLFLSRLLTHHYKEIFQNPTIIVIVDREDLDAQTSKIFETAKHYLGEQDVRSIVSQHDDLKVTLKDRASGGIYITTIQKFCEKTGLLSDRNNIICISDEAHRTQTSVNAKEKKTEEGIFTTYGFGYYLRTSFPNAVYCGFTGTPIDETLAVFGDVVESYTMRESCEDGITVRIVYEPRLARVIVHEKQAKEIQKYYEHCADTGASEEQIEKSKRAMSRLKKILEDNDRLDKLAADIVTHYETLCSEKPDVVQKAMIVCYDREIAFKLLKKIISIRPDWGVKRKAEHEEQFSEEELKNLPSLPKINLVATQSKEDHDDLREICGTREYRKSLDEHFKNNHSNFKIAIVVDMWITGFDVPSLSVMYIDKPLQKHTLIQTISRVNRVFEGKDRGLVVDYIGIKNDMMEAVKKYGSPLESPVDEIKDSLCIFRNHLALIDELLIDFNDSGFYTGVPLEKLYCLNEAAEYVQRIQDVQTRFMNLSLRLKKAYVICSPSGELTDEEPAKAQFYLAIRSVIYKQTKGNAPDAETMNRFVENMVSEAISCTGIESIVDADKQVDLFSEEFLEELKKVKLPITRFHALLKLLRKAIIDYGRTNKIKSVAFDERLKTIVDRYNSRDNLVFTSDQMAGFVNHLSEQLIQILKDLQEDRASFEKMGISYEEKAFFDILVKVRDTHQFQYEDEKCLILAKEIKKLVEDKSKFADWSARDDIKNQLNMDLTVLLYKHKYPPEWNEEVFEKVMKQAENFKKYSN